MYLRLSYHYTLANMALAKGHSSKTKSQMRDIRTIGPLVIVMLLNINTIKSNKFENQTVLDALVCICINLTAND